MLLVVAASCGPEALREETQVDGSGETFQTASAKAKQSVSLWAPNAKQVFVVGEFTDGGLAPMRSTDGGHFELALTSAQFGQRYHFVVVDSLGSTLR